MEIPVALEWVSGTAVKTPFAMVPSPFAVPGLKSLLPAMHTLEGSKCWLKDLGACHLPERFSLCSQLQPLAWPGITNCRYLGSKPVYGFLSLLLKYVK